MEEMERLRQLLISSVGAGKRKVIFYGSGTYHHLAWLGISLIDEPVTVIHFDNHTDFVRDFLPGYIHCGSWVTRVLTLPNVRKVIQIGVEADLGFGRTGHSLPMGWITHKMNLLHNRRVEIYPNSTRRSVLLGRICATLPCVALEPDLLTTEARWKNMLDHGGIKDTLERVLSTLPTETVYLTIDKDVLNEKYCFSNCTGFHGTLALDDLLMAISLIGKRKSILGVDVCGDGSYFATRGYPLKHLFARLTDKAPPSAFSSPDTIRRNEDANLKIMERLIEAQA